MKILLVGEYSGLHLNLRDGLRELGHEAYIASTGDTWKNIANDISLGDQKKDLLSKFSRNMRPFMNLGKLTGYDVVQFINPLIFNPRFNINTKLIEFLIRNNNKTFFLAAGCDYLFHKSKTLNYSPCKGCKTLDYPNGCPFTSGEEMAASLFAKADGVIPIGYDYSLSHSRLANIKPYVPLPLNANKVVYRQNKSLDRVRFFHGLNRPGFKGTQYVKESFDLLTNKYAKGSEFLIDGYMPLQKYLEVMQSMNVVVDQTSAYCSGMNALFAMAMGKVVLGGSEKEANEFQYGEESPVINIRPSVTSVSEAIEYCLDNKENLSEWGARSRAFVQKHHDHIAVAAKYVQIYKGVV
ncbi:MAG: glycosyltransferase [Hydrogenophilales bacterium CG_4_10_14_3_um_filter_58_23]|nr:MAG: glycosyltransferase [Zetaproteobacteria bacterium CG23_combo_of_CG06-09_8_20_14_all_54_7]PIQ13022.1 MAG: glycosyltransferase [Hydrogenophilales bacterium CG18_big_fil_WC_8_21_14_2_50_58_12]PIX99634.1 MAG: glycosyltransferase [Hydrogenophilales bacterium CG_4_10_14_3_um_filter_58_23]